jgi:RNA polymerase sigma-70 factor (ECF subfamily)
MESPPSNPRPWLFAVALNLARDDGRQGARRERRLELLKAESPQSVDAPDLSLERRERVEGVRAALDQLAERDREALLLKAEGFSYDEIASALGLARGAVGTTLARARRRLVEAYHAQHGARDVAR